MSSTLEERKIGHIYDALDTGSYRNAISLCNQLLKKQPKYPIVQTLKALALLRSGKANEGRQLVDEVIEAKPNDVRVLSAIHFTLAPLGELGKLTSLYEEAVKANPHNDDLSEQLFMLYVRLKDYQSQQQLAFRMHKTFKQDRYFWWSMQSYLLHSRNTSAPTSKLALPLAERMISARLTTTPLTSSSAEQVYLYARVLEKQGKFEEALKMLDGDICRELRRKSMSLEIFRADILRKAGSWDILRAEAKEKLDSEKDKNWSTFLNFLDASFELGGDENIANAKELLERISSREGQNERTPKLALMELVKRAQERGLRLDETETLRDRCLSYFDVFANKACCHEDLLPYVTALGEDERKSFLEDLPSKSPATRASAQELRRYINVSKLRRSLQSPALSSDAQMQEAEEYSRSYFEGLALGKDLPKTELQPADDLVIMAAQAYITALSSSSDFTCLRPVISLLETASLRSPKNYQIHLLLVRLYRLLGAFSLARDHYNAAGIKQVQNDTLSHFLFDRASIFSPVDSGDITVTSALTDVLTIYKSNATETPEMTTKAYRYETYSRIEEFVDFRERLERSLQRQVLRLEKVRADLRMGDAAALEEARRLAEDVSAALEGIELHDNRDYRVLPSYSAFDAPTTAVLTSTHGLLNIEWVRAALETVAPAVGVNVKLDHGANATVVVHEKQSVATNPDGRLQLTAQEVALRDFARMLSESADATQAGEKDLLSFFTKREQELNEGLQGKLPWEALHVATSALEGYIILDLYNARCNPAGQARKGITATISAADAARPILGRIASALWTHAQTLDTAEARSQWVDDCSQLLSAAKESGRLDRDAVIDVGRRTLKEQKRALEALAEGIRKRIGGE